MANKASRSQTRRLFRRKLESWGMDNKEIKLCMQQVSANQMAKERGEIPRDAPLCTRAEYVRLMRKHAPDRDRSQPHYRIGDDYVAPDDKGYKPTVVDPLLKGAARATGVTAKVVKRGKTVTKSQYGDL